MEGRKDRRMDGRTDRPYFIGPFRLLPRVQKDRDKKYIKNWRPISLLNVDTKMISKALATKLKKLFRQ